MTPRNPLSRPATTADLLDFYSLRDAPVTPDEKVAMAGGRWQASTAVQRTAVATHADTALCPACGDNVVSLLSEHYNVHHPDVHAGR